jgi:hypothetical protein
MLCIYCQIAEADTVDHIPPQCLFGAPLPPRLIKVPACSGCNGGASPDDEYFKFFLATRAANESNPFAAALAPSIKRALENPRAAGFAALVRANTRFIDDPVTGGTKPQFYVDNDRLCLVASRIVRGLHYHETHVPLPVDFPIVAAPDTSWSFHDFPLGKSPAAVQIEVVNGAAKVEVVERAFSYWHYAFHDDDRGIWLLKFFEGTDVLVYAGWAAERQLFGNVGGSFAFGPPEADGANPSEPDTGES